MATAARLLHDKTGSGSMGVVTIKPDASALEAAKLMNDHHIGALIVVSSSGRPVGIFTERDLLTRIVASLKDPVSTPFEDVMTREMLVCPPEAPLDDMLTLLHE